MPALLSILVLDPKLRSLRRACAILMYLTILVAGSVPGARAEIGHYASGAVLHSTAYAVLAFLWFTGSTGSTAARAAKAVLAVAMMGAGDEFVQSFFPYRGAAVSDWMVDCAAAIVTSAFLCAVLPTTERAGSR
ncbi:MAG: VanZ family protein [Telluria sp.]